MDDYVLLAKDNIFFKEPRSLEIKRGWMEVKVYLYTDCINIHTVAQFVKFKTWKTDGGSGKVALL